jgi:glycosyltransferase involved in cell wall biosynthesis
MNPLKELAVVTQLWLDYNREKPAIVHHFDFKQCIYGSIAARLAGVPVVVNSIIGLGFTFINGGVLKVLIIVLWRLACKSGTWTTFQNADDRRHLEALQLVDPSRTDLIRGAGVDCDRYSSDGVSPLPASRQEVRFLMFARIVKYKGVLDYLEAAKRVVRRYNCGMTTRAPRFVLLGGALPGNPTKVPATLLTHPDSLPPGVIARYVDSGVIEHRPHVEDVIPHIHASDVVVLPSYSEGLPRSLLEAMACCKPIIATDVPGCREVCRDMHNGLLVPPRDVHALAEAFEYFLNNTDQLLPMGRAGRQLVLDEFSEGLVVEKTLESYCRAGARL